MIIKNLTSKVQKIEVADLVGDHRQFEIFIEPGSKTDLENIIILHPESMAGILEIEGVEIPEIKEDIKEEAAVDGEDEEAVVVESGEDDLEINQTEKFICDICGEEFASARGVMLHKSRSHAINN